MARKLVEMNKRDFESCMQKWLNFLRIQRIVGKLKKAIKDNATSLIDEKRILYGSKGRQAQLQQAQRGQQLYSVSECYVQTGIDRLRNGVECWICSFLAQWTGAPLPVSGRKSIILTTRKEHGTSTSS